MYQHTQQNSFFFWTQCPEVNGSIFSCQFYTFRHSVQKSLFRCIALNFSTIKGIIHLCVWRNFHAMQMLHIVLNVKGIFRVKIGQLFVPLVLCYIKLISEKRSHTPKLHDTFSAIHDRYLLLTHKLFSGLLIIQTIGLARTSCIRGIIKVNRFFTQYFRQLF